MTIEDLLAERAGAMAAHDGVPVARVHIHGAANQLQAELLRARDHALQPPAAPEPDAPEAVPEAAPESAAPKSETPSVDAAPAEAATEEAAK